MGAGDPAQVRSIIQSIKQFKTFRNMCAYNISCFLSHVTPPTVGWRENIETAIAAEGVEGIIDLLREHKDALDIIRGATMALSGVTTNSTNAAIVAKKGGVEAALNAMLGLSQEVASTMEGDDVANAGSELLEKVAQYNPGAILDSAGGVDAVLDGVQHTTNDRVKAACATVADRVGVNERGRKELLKKKALEALIAAIAPGTDNTEETLKPVFRLLERFAEDPANVKKIRELGGVEALVVQLEAHADSEALLRAGGRLLAKVAEGDLEAAIERLKRGGLSEDAREFTTALLANLALQPENIDRIVAQGGVKVLIQNFDQFNEKTQIAAARALGRVATNKANVAEIIREGGVKKLVEAMRANPDNAELVSACTQAISNIATSSKEHAAMVHAQGGIKEVLQSLKRHPEFDTNAQAALTMLAQLATIGFDVAALVDMGAVEAILGAMEANFNNVEVQRSGFRALTALIANGPAAGAKSGPKSAALAVLSHKHGLGILVQSLEVHRSRDLVVSPAVETFSMLVSKEKSAVDKLTKSGAVDAIISAVYSQMLAAALGSVQAASALNVRFERNVRTVLAACVGKKDAAARVKAVAQEGQGLVGGRESSAEPLEAALMGVTVLAKEPALAKIMAANGLAATLVGSYKGVAEKSGLPLQSSIMAAHALAVASFARAGSEHLAALDGQAVTRVVIDAVKKHTKDAEATICALRALRAFGSAQSIRKKMVAEGVVEAAVAAMRSNGADPFVALAALDLMLSLAASDDMCADVAYKGGTRQAIKMIQESSTSEEFERPSERALMVLERVVSGKGAAAEDVRQNLVKQGAVEGVTRAMESYPWNDVIESTGARLLSRLLDASGVEAEIDKMAHLVAELKKSSRPETVLPKLSRSMATVGALALTPSNTAIMLRKNAAGIIIDALHRIAKMPLTKEREYGTRAGFRALGQLASMSPLESGLGAVGLVVEALKAPTSKVTLIEKMGVLDCVKSMASVESAADALVKAGVVASAVALCKEHSHDEGLVTSAFGALGAVAEHEKGASECTKAGCVRLALDLMKNFGDQCSPRFSEEGLGLLANLALVSRNIGEMLDAGVVDLVTATLEQHCGDPASPEPRVLTAAVGLLQRLATSEETVRLVVRKGAVRKVVEIALSSAVYQSDAECMEAVLFLLETCAMVKDTHETLVKAGAVDLIMSALNLNSTNESVTLIGSKALQTLLGSSGDTVKVLLDEVAKLAAQLKKKPHDRELQALLSNALRNLANLTLVEGVVNARVAGDVAKTSVDAMSTVQAAVGEGPSKQELLTAAMQVLGRSALIDGGKIDTNKALKALLAVIEASRGDDQVLESGMFALGNLAVKGPDAVRAVVAGGGVALVERTMNEAAENERLRDAAAAALDKIRGTAAASSGALAKDKAGINALAEILMASSNDPASLSDFLQQVAASPKGASTLLGILGSEAFRGASPQVRAELLRVLQEQLGGGGGGGGLAVTSAADMAGLLAALDEKADGMNKADKAALVERQVATLDVVSQLDAGASGKTFAAAGGVGKLLALLAANQDDPEVVRAVLKALSQMASDKGVVDKLVEADAAKAIAAAMKGHGEDQDINGAAIELLAKMAAAKGVAKIGADADTMRLLNRVVDKFKADRDIQRNGNKLLAGLSSIYQEDSADMVGSRLDAALLALAGSGHIKELYDENGKRYYFDTRTGQTSWDMPAEYADSQAALSALAKLTAAHKDNVSEMDPSALQAALDEFQTHANEPGRITDLAKTLGVLATNEQNRQEIAKAGGLEAILAALNGDNVDPEFLAAAIHLLNQFARNDYFKEQISKLGGIEALILIMLKFIEHLNVVEKCLSTLANLCYNSSANMAQVMKYDGVEAVKKTMNRYSSEEPVLHFAMVLLSNLMFGNDENKVTIGKIVGQEVVQVTRDHFSNPRLFKGALRCLGNLSFVDSNILWICQNGATKAIVAGMIANEDDLEAQQIAVEVLGNFGSYSEDDPAIRRKIERGEQTSVYDIIVVEGGAKRILDTVKHTDEPALMMSGLEALSNLANNAVIVDKLIKMGIVEMVFFALSKYDWDEDLVERSMRLVAILTYSSDGVKAIGESDGVQIILNAMESHEDQPEFLTNAAAALKNVASNEQLRDEIGTLGGVKSVLDLFEKNMEHQPFLVECLTLFIRLTRSEELSEQLATKGLNTLLAAIAAHKNDVGFLVPAFTLIGHLAFAPNNLRVIVQYGGIDVLVDTVLEHPESKNLVIRAIQCMDNIAMASAEHSKIVKDAGGTQVIEEVMGAYKGDAEVTQICKSALLSMQPQVERRKAKAKYAFRNEQQDDYRQSSEDPLKDFRNMLKAGATLTEYKNGTPYSRHLYVKPDFKAIAWKDPKRSARTENIINLRDVRNVRSGLHDGHKGRGRKAPAADVAFCIIARATSLDLTAATPADRDRWVTALSELIRVYKMEPQWLR